MKEKPQMKDSTLALLSVMINVTVMQAWLRGIYKYQHVWHKAGVLIQTHTGGAHLQQVLHSRIEDVVLLVFSQRINGPKTKCTLFWTHQYMSSVWKLHVWTEKNKHRHACDRSNGCGVRIFISGWDIPINATPTFMTQHSAIWMIINRLFRMGTASSSNEGPKKLPWITSTEHIFSL